MQSSSIVESDSGMGKKSKDLNEDAGAAAKFLFGADNPFRRKPQPAFAFGDRPQPATEIGYGLDPSLAKNVSITEAAEVRKMKREREIGSALPTSPPSADEPVPRKRKKLEEKEEEGEPKKKYKKRKRDEVEAEYEKIQYGLRKEDEAAAAVVAVGVKRKAADATADMFESTKESFDDENKLLRTVFVGNLPLKMKRKLLLREFAGFGEIDSVRIRSVPLVDTKAPRRAAIITGKINEEVDSVNAYIVFKDEQSAQAALAYNMTQIGGKHIRVDMACPPRKKMKGEAQLYDRKRTVFVGNLPFDVKDEELYQLFCGLSPSEPNVQAVRVIRDPHTSLGKGFAYVLFKTRDAANSVCRRKDLKIRDRFLRVYHAKSDATTSKGKEGSSRDFPRKRLASALDGETPGSGKIPKTAVGASLSYQGLRSSKKGAVKKTLRSQPSGNHHSGYMKSSWKEPKGRKTKRPAVAARKAKQLKRKQMSSTPENIHRYKKARKQ